MHKLAQRLDKWLHSHLFLLLALLVLLLLRIPNFFEPYWYGDEGIYLTVGNGIKAGERLYADIIDHKTPLIYYLAAVPTQLSFRFLNLSWMIATTIAFYGLGLKLFKEKRHLHLSLISFVLLTTLPWLEGNIPNGELFVMGFVLMAGWILSKTALFDFFLNKKKDLKKISEPGKLVAAGILLGLAILTKIPAVLDLAAFLTIGWFALTNHISDQKKHLLISIPKQLLILGLGVLLPIVISIIYFIAIGAGQDYLDFGLLYNFRYASTWGLPFQSVILEQLFTLQGKMLIAGVMVLILTIRKKWFTPVTQFVVSWFLLALIGSLLSNRPYPHYFQQLVPPLTLMLGLIWQYLEDFSKYMQAFIMSTVALALFIAAMLLLEFRPYPTLEYYQKFTQLITNQISADVYRDSFNYLMPDNYEAAKIIKKSGVKEIFIWGTNPMLYALSDTNPTGRFTVSFHIKDFNAYDETYQDLVVREPQFIVVMKNETEELPGLNHYLTENYVVNANFDYFDLWMRLDTKQHVN